MQKVYKFTHEQQERNFSAFNYRERPIGKASKDLEIILPTKDMQRLSFYLQPMAPHIKGGMLYSYIEAHFWDITPETLDLIIDIEPRLVCLDVASPLLNSNNIPALLKLIERGYEIDNYFIQSFRLSMKGALECCDSREERAETVKYYTYLVQFLQNLGFDIKTPE